MWKTKLPLLMLVSATALCLVWHVSVDTDPPAALDSFFLSPPGHSSKSHHSIRRNLQKMFIILDEANKAPLPSETQHAGFLAKKEIHSCPVMKVSELSANEQRPQQDRSRYQVTPPEGGLLHLLCCQTTKGPLNALVHEQWAPLGAKRVLDMVQSGYFNSERGVPLMRCIKGFICQFGLNSDKKLSQQFSDTIKDDATWLPEGKKHRKNKDGVVRFARGYLAFAGSDLNTRSNQFIVSLDAVESLAGGSPWEVPWGELVGQHSFDTLSNFFTGYGEDGPAQEDLWQAGMTDDMVQQFPKLDYITGCSVVDQAIQTLS